MEQINMKNPLEMTIVEFTDLVRHWTEVQEPATSIMFSVHHTSSDNFDSNHTVSDTFSRIAGPAGALAMVTSAMISAERKARDNNDFEFADILQTELTRFNSVFGLEPKIEPAAPSRRTQ